MTRAILLLCLSVTVLLGSACRDQDATTQALRTLLAQNTPPPALSLRHWTLLRQIYRDRDYRPLWLVRGRPGGETRVDSSVGPATMAALNLPIEARIRQIELNLERYRWLPSDFGERHILVNIPDFQLYAYKNRQQVLTMGVIVGEEYGNATPVFADSMTYLVFHPEWDIPRQILVDEVIPRVREDIYYLAQHGYELVDTARNEVIADPKSIDWSDLDTAKIHFRIRQKAGTANALGKVKFMFPNQFSIYLHDTPAARLFDRQKRTLSHGCVRVEDPVKLAGYVLDHQQGWDDDKIRQVLQAATALTRFGRSG